jgi:hypothetical protein
MFDDRIDAVSLDDRTITKPHNEVLDAHPDRDGASRTSYGVPGDLVTAKAKKIFAVGCFASLLF